MGEVDMGKTILIVGATSEIGIACAKLLCKESDMTLVLTGRNREKLNLLNKELSCSLYIYEVDVTQTGMIKQLFSDIYEEGLRLDGFIYAAGVLSEYPVKICDLEQLEYSMLTNCYGFFSLGKLFYNKKYSNDNSSIVAISSMASKLCDKGMLPYSMSKAALNAAVKTMSKEYEKRGIRVNCVLPRGVKTEMSRKKMKYLNKTEEDWDNLLDVEQVARDIIAVLYDTAKNGQEVEIQ